MAAMALPDKHRQRLQTTNMQERLDEEIRRRERVIRIFPNDESARRLIGAFLAEQNDTWLERTYLDVQEYHEWVATHNAARQHHPAGRHPPGRITKCYPTARSLFTAIFGLDHIHSWCNAERPDTWRFHK